MSRTNMNSIKLWPTDGSGVKATQATVTYSKPLEIGDSSFVSFQMEHSAAVSGTVDVQFSNHPQPVTMAYNSAADPYYHFTADQGWITDSTLSSSVATTTSGSVGLTFSRVGWRHFRLKLSSTNSSTNAQLIGYANGKS